MVLKLKNNAVSSLAAPLSTDETMIRILAGHGVRFPVLNDGDWFPLAVQNVQGDIEYMRAVSRAGDVMTVIRAQEESEPLLFEAGDAVFLAFTVAAIKASAAAGGSVSVSVGNSTVTG